MPEPAPYPEDRPRAATIRSRLMLQVTDYLVGEAGWARKQAEVHLRRQGDESSVVRFSGSDSPDAVLAVARGELDVAVVNPATAARAVLIDAGWLGEPPVASIATVPSYDQMAFAVRGELGVRTLSELAELRPRLSLSLRAQRDHAVHQFVRDSLDAAGILLEDLVRWGGVLHYDPGLPHLPDRWRPIVEGERNAVFDEGVYNWGEELLRRGWAFLEVDDAALRRLEARGYREGVLTRERFPSLSVDVTTVDFSGFMVCVQADADQELVASVCSALVARREFIPWQGGPVLPLGDMTSDSQDAPLGLPLHPAAAAFWARAGLDPASESFRGGGPAVRHSDLPGSKSIEGRNISF